MYWQGNKHSTRNHRNKKNIQVRNTSSILKLSFPMFSTIEMYTVSLCFLSMTIPKQIEAFLFGRPETLPFTPVFLFLSCFYKVQWFSRCPPHPKDLLQAYLLNSLHNTSQKVASERASTQLLRKTVDNCLHNEGCWRYECVLLCFSVQHVHACLFASTGH
jgi:hypothetical protein